MNKKTYLLIIFTFLFLTIAYSGILLTDWNTLPFGGGDLYPYLNWIQHDIQQLRQGELPIYNDQIYCGNYPEYISPLSGIWYPPIFIIFNLFSESIAYRLFILFHVALSAISFWILSKTFSSDKYIRLFGSLTYSSSGIALWLLSWGPMDMFAAYALLPLFLHFLSRSIEKNSWKEGIKAGTILGLIGLAGAWYAIYWGIFVAFIIMGFSYFRKRKTLNLKAIIGLSISFLIIIGWKIASIFIYQIEMIRNNVHRGAVPVLEVVERTINPYELVVHHVPGPLSPEYISLGLIILALAVVGVTALRWHWAVLSMFFFLIYSQEYGNILNDIILTFGLTGFFPDMERAIIMLNLFLILLAVSGLDSLIKKKEHDFAISFIFAFAVIEFAAVMFIFSLQLFPSIGTVFLAVTVVVTSIYLFFTSNSLNKTKFIAGISLFGSLLIFTIMMNSFPQEIPAYSEEKNQIANKVIAETHNDWIFLSKEVYIDGLLTHEMLKEGGRIVNPYNGYHFENDFSCGKYYLGKSNTFEEHAEVYFQYKNPESYHVNLEPIKDIGSQWRLYKVNRVLIKNRNVEFN